MVIALVFMVLMVLLAVAVTATVVIGMQGHGKRRAPQLADQMARAARHLNGEAQPPKRLEHLFH